jgi:predicted hydrocarbon binding protein
MKGLVFREFLEMVENEFGYETVDTIIEKSKVPSNGVYTSVGTYKAEEMFALVGELSRETNIPVNKLLFTFGKYIFNVFLKSYPVFFEHKKNSFELLADVEGKIHVEVLKLYPEAELPSFDVEMVNDKEMVMVYRSKRSMGDFAEGLIVGCTEFFNEKASIEKEIIEKDGTVVSFRIRM